MIPLIFDNAIGALVAASRSTPIVPPALSPVPGAVVVYRHKLDRAALTKVVWFEVGVLDFDCFHGSGEVEEGAQEAKVLSMCHALRKMCRLCREEGGESYIATYPCFVVGDSHGGNLA